MIVGFSDLSEIKMGIWCNFFKSRTAPATVIGEPYFECHWNYILGR